MYLDPQPGESYLDLTAGYGGHASKVLSNTGDASRMTLVDRDESAISSLQPLVLQGARLIHSDFATAARELHTAGDQFDMILIDLGVSSPHLDNKERGFSFMHDAPLDMRMDPRQEVTAADIINTSSEDELVDILRRYGEEPKAKRIARALVQVRPVQTTFELADVVESVYGRRGKTHPATRTFQAVRIAVNKELEQVQQTLVLLPDLLSAGGRVVVISFHSLEDRLVKQFFSEQMKSGYEAQLQILTKKPVSGKIEQVFNPRARSAMLRAAVKIKI
ncbi:16S rRNA (cytosine(1402)-N(4))-methyltransferase RsmH [Candidatus Saccharibacteria bacterium]|nr:16S rRNA (cytosine(1402)-N(4))-methyltransferase RsmH [Candidatus Saccharibacteria bacterium]